MADQPRTPRPLPGDPMPETETGASTGLVTRIVIVATVLLGQLFAITVALEASLLDSDGEAWLLAGFSVLSFVVVLVLIGFEPPPRASRLPRRMRPDSRVYVARPAKPLPRPPASGRGGAAGDRPEPR